MALRSFKYAILLMVVGAASLTIVAGQGGPESLFCVATPEPAFCESMIIGARTAVQATGRAIRITIVVSKQVDRAVRLFVKRLPKDVPPSLKDTVIDTCNKDYQEILSNYLSALDYLHSGNIKELVIKMSGLPMEKCLREVADIVINPAIVNRLIDNLKKYAEYTKLIAANIKK